MLGQEMSGKDTGPGFGRWAITGVIAPVLAILAVTFVVAPIFWPDVAHRLCDALGWFFVLYLIFLVCAATVWKILRERRCQSGASPAGKGDEPEPRA